MEIRSPRLVLAKVLAEGFNHLLNGKPLVFNSVLVQFEEPLEAKHITTHLLKVAAEQDYDTVVVGRHCLSGRKRWFQHPLSEEIVRAAEGVTIWVVE